MSSRRTRAVRPSGRTRRRAAVLGTAALAVLFLSACGASDNGGTIQTPPSTSGGSVSTTSTTPSTTAGNTLPGGD